MVVFYKRFFERTILLNKRFYWMIVQWKNERSTLKMNNDLRQNEIYYFLNDWKKWVVHERSTNQI